MKIKIKVIEIGAKYKYRGNLLYERRYKKSAKSKLLDLSDSEFIVGDSIPVKLRYLPLKGLVVTVIWLSPDGYYTIEYNASGLDENAVVGQTFCWIMERDLIGKLP
jgi:hypothetical protein